MGLSQARHRDPHAGHVDVIGDIIESANLVIRRPRTASIVFGGGTPKNFINQATVQAEFYDDRVSGHRYALQIVTDVPYFGGASGSSLEEARSWGKLAADAEQVTVHADATIALPLLASALATSAVQILAARERSAFRSGGSDHGRRRTAASTGPFRGTRMSFPFEYDHGAPLAFGGALPVTRSFDDSRAVVLPVPLDRTTSYVAGTRNGPREILQASSHMELWDEEIGADVHSIGIFTLPEMELPFGELAPLMDEIRRVASEVLDAGQVPRDARRRALDHAAARRRRRRAVTPGCRSCRSTRTPTCATATWARRTTTPARCDGAWSTRRSRRSGSAACRPRKPTCVASLEHDDLLRRHACAAIRAGSIVSSTALTETVYITIDVDGMDPAIMPATGTPEPGGLSWYEILALLRATMAQQNGRRLRRRRAEPAPGTDGAEFPVREAGLQDSRRTASAWPRGR